MSYEVITGDDEGDQFASNKGYADLIAAAAGLPALEQLIETGESEEVAAVVADLEQIKSPADVKETAQGLIKLIRGKDSILISDGLQGSVEKAEDEFEIVADIVKLDKVQHLCFGWFSIVEVEGRRFEDTQGDIIKPETIENSAYEFVLTARVGGEMHEDDDTGEVRGVGRLVESVVFTKEKVRAMVSSLHDQGIVAVMDLGCVAWWGGMKIDDPDTWDKIQTGKLRAWSIGGSGKREKLEHGET